MRTHDRTTARLMRGVEHIERHIGDDISLSEVAASAALSEYHFHRLFRSRFGMPVMDYVRRRRIARAAQELLGTSTPILHIALEAGFESQAAFTRAFRKVYHTSPAAFRTRGRSVPWLSAAPISQAVLMMLPGLGTEQPRREIIGEFVVEGIAATLDGTGRNQIPQIWHRLAQRVGFKRFTECDRIGISEGDAATLDGVLGYMAALFATGRGEGGGELARRTIPAGAYLVFRFEGAFTELAAAHDYIFSTWMPGSRHVLRSSPNFTRLPAQNGNGAGHEIWIPVEDQ